MRFHASAIVATIVSTIAIHAGAQGEDVPTTREPKWDRAWPHANAWDYSLAGVAATAFAVEGLALQWHQAPLRWTDPILFDQDARSALRAGDPNVRHGVDTASWVLLTTQIAYPLVVDVPYAWARYGRRLASDLFWQDAATLFLAGAVDLAVRDIAGRARPPVYDCIHAGGGTDCVDNPEAVRSFPGGHTLTATAGAVLTCTQHLYVRIYGNAWDSGLCALALSSNVTVMFMRIIADSHWASDQLAGAAIGSLIGWGVPYVMHFRFHSKPTSGVETRSSTTMIMPTILPVERGAGAGAVGMF